MTDGVVAGDGETNAIVAHLEAQYTVGLADPQRGGCTVTSVLTGVLEGLDAAEIHAGFNLRVVSMDDALLNGGGQRGTARRSGKRFGEPAGGQQWRKDAVGQRA